MSAYYTILFLCVLFSGANLKAMLINQVYHPPDLEAIFSYVQPPDLNEMFEHKRARFNKRTSSAIWNSPMHNPR